MRLHPSKVGGLAWLVALSGCQSMGAFSSPRTLPAGAVRLGASLTYNDFAVTDERQRVADFQAVCQVGVTDKNELDFLAYLGGADARLKHDFLGDANWDLSLSSGLGVFTTTQSDQSSLYVPVALVGGYRFTDDISVFVGPKLYAALALGSEGLGGGFNQSQAGLLGGGVLGVALESKHLTFMPQITWMTPLATGAQGSVVQIVLGFGTNVR